MAAIDLIILIGLILVLVTSVYTGIHARQHGKSALWGLVVMFTGFFGLSVYAMTLAGDAKRAAE